MFTLILGDKVSTQSPSTSPRMFTLHRCPYPLRITALMRLAYQESAGLTAIPRKSFPFPCERWGLYLSPSYFPGVCVTRYSALDNFRCCCSGRYHFKRRDLSPIRLGRWARPPQEPPAPALRLTSTATSGFHGGSQRSSFQVFVSAG